MYKTIQIMGTASCVPSLLFTYLYTYYLTFNVAVYRPHNCILPQKTSLQNLSQPLFGKKQICVNFSKVCNRQCIFHLREDMWRVLVRTMIQALLMKKCIKEAFSSIQNTQNKWINKQNSTKFCLSRQQQEVGVVISFHLVN